MFVHIWRMRARKKRIADYEKFGRQVTLPSLNKINGCLGAHFIRVHEVRRPEYLWLVFWKDHKSLEQARANPIWRDQIKKFEAGKFNKSIPLEARVRGTWILHPACGKTQAGRPAEEGSESRSGQGRGTRDDGICSRRNAGPDP